MSYFTYQNKQIHYQVNGEGKPLLILNGIMMSTKSWDPFVESFKDYQLIRVDFFDQGLSDALEEDYTQEVQVDMLYHFLKYLKIEKVNVVGISYGGEIAILFALKYQQIIEKLIVFNSVAYTTDILKTTGHVWNQYAKQRDTLNYYEQTIPVIYSKTFIEKNKEWMENRKNLLCSTVFKDPVFLDKMIRLTNSAESFDARDRLNELNIPVLIVAAEEDELTPPSEQRLIASLIKDSRIVIIPGVGHASMYEDPELFVSLVIGFLAVDHTIKIV